MENIYEFKRKMNKRGIFWSFSGPVSRDLLAGTFDILKQKMRAEGAGGAVILRVFSTVSQISRNIISYSDEKSPKSKIPGDGGGLSIGIIAVGHEADHYFVMGGNMIKNENVENFCCNLEKLRKIGVAIAKGELRWKKIAILSRNHNGDDFPHGFRPGSGCFEMASKASEPIVFDFEKVDEKKSFFSLKLVI